MYFPFNKIESVFITRQINLPKNDKVQNDQYYIRSYCEKNHIKTKKMRKEFLNNILHILSISPV